MPHCAFLTLEHRGDFVIDDEHAIAPLTALGWHVDTIPWRQRERPWSDWDAVVVRSTWDWFEAPEAFLATLHEIDAATRLANPLRLMEWNLAKTYLRDLETRGVPIVPTLWLDGCDAAALGACRARFGDAAFVLKPVFGANGEDTFRLADDDTAARAAVERLGDRPCMAQPFRTAIATEGEFSVFLFAGEASHAILKVPARGEFRSQEERGADIRPVPLAESLRTCATRALGALDTRPLYARADFVRCPEGHLELMELELIEPSLYLRTDPEAPTRFARAVDAWFKAPR